ncbi:hypothetical protein BC829DRAFT_447172 [Chytridium lagenaria]|nr:hypothetical protein BC829DRAFT_447172 [Chytridium lagenaria]
MEAPDLEQDRWDVAADQVLRHVGAAEVVANGAVVNEAVRIAAIEKARQWNEVESTINNVLTEHMDSTMRLKFNSSTAYTSIYRRFRAFELSLHHDSGHTVDSIQGELKTDYFTQALTMSPFNNGLKNLFKQNKFTKISEVVLHLQEEAAQADLARARHEAYLRPGPAGANDDMAPRANRLDSPCPCTRGERCPQLKNDRHCLQCTKCQYYGHHSKRCSPAIQEICKKYQGAPKHSERRNSLRT